MGFFDRFRKAPRADRARAASGSALVAPGPAHAQPDRDRRLDVSTPSRPLDEPRFVVLDVETTGLRAHTDRIVEVALVTTDPWGRVLDEWGTRINPQGPVGATHIHGITDADVAGAPVFADVLPELNARLAGAAVCAHNARFDLSFLRSEYHRTGWRLPYLPALCTLEASAYHLPLLDRRRLSDCCDAVGARLDGAHSALGDARATAALLAAFMHPHLGVPPRPADLELPRSAWSIQWPTGPAGPPSPTGRASRPAPPPRVRRALARASSAGPSQPLVELVKGFSLVDALDEGAPTGTLAYLERLTEVLEDGEVSTAEAQDLDAVAQAHDLSSSDIVAANRAFVLALAHEALTDGKVTRVERAELKAVAELLAVDSALLPGLLDRAEQARHTRLSAGLGPLPDPWPHGEPLRVGDKVVFTGCPDHLRDRLEERSEALGVRILGSVSPKTAMLVTDGTMDGTKLAKAGELGTRIVDPDTYATLLEHLQPAQTPGGRRSRPAALPAVEPAVTTLDEAAELGSVETADPAHLDPAQMDPSEIRRWGRERGWVLGERGRLPASLYDAYAAAHRVQP